MNDLGGRHLFLLERFQISVSNLRDSFLVTSYENVHYS